MRALAGSFFLFGMGNRRKYLYKQGSFVDMSNGEVLRKWYPCREYVLPSEYTVILKTSGGRLLSEKTRQEFGLRRLERRLV